MDAVIDEKLRQARKLRALARPVPGADFLMARVAEDLAERLSVVERRFGSPVAAFCQTRHAAEAMVRSGRCAGPVRRIEEHVALLGDDEGKVSGDAADFAFEPQSADLLVSLLSLHGLNDLPGMLARMRRALQPDGLLVVAAPGAGTLGELRDSLLHAEAGRGGASPRVMPFVDVREAGALLQRAGFALPVVDVETVTVRYATMTGLMRDLRAMGETNALTGRLRRPTPGRLFRDAAMAYAHRHADADGRIRATFSIVWMSGWAPHPSQQKPLRRGSAQASLEAALREAGDRS